MLVERCGAVEQDQEDGVRGGGLCVLGLELCAFEVCTVHIYTSKDFECTIINVDKNRDAAPTNV